MNARPQTGTAPIAVCRHDTAVLLALAGGGVLLVGAVLAALLLGLDAEGGSAMPAALLLGAGAFVALGAARLVPAAPRPASLLCLLAVVPATAVYLPQFAHRLHEHYPGPGFPPSQPTLGEVVTPLVAWLLAAAPLACAALLSRRRAARSG